MIRGIVFIILFWLYQIIAFPFLLYLKHLQKKGQVDRARTFAHERATCWAKWVLRRVGTTLEIRGREHLPEGPVLFACNHQGAFDIPILLSAFDRPTAFIAKQELIRIPLVGSWMHMTDCVAIDRSSARGAIETFKQAAKKIDSGVSMVVFPEGTRSAGGPMIPFKKGSLRLAHHGESIPIVPVTLNDSWRIKPGGALVFHPTKVVLVVHPPVEVTGLDKAARRDLPARIHDIVATGLLDTADGQTPPPPSPPNKPG